MRTNTGRYFCYTCCLLAAFLVDTKTRAQAPVAPTGIYQHKAQLAERKPIVARADSLFRTDSLKIPLPDSLLPDALTKKGQHYLQGKSIPKPLTAGVKRIKDNFFEHRVGASLKEGRAKIEAYASKVGPLAIQRDSLRRLGQVKPDSLLAEYGARYGDQLEKELADRLELDKLPQHGPDAYADLLGNELPAPELPLRDGSGIQPAIDLKKLQANHFPDPSAVQPAMDDLQTLKNKYRVLADSRQRQDAQSRKSLKGQPLPQRMEVGIGVHALAYKPFSGEIAISAGYRFNADWRAGAGVLLGAGALANAVPAGYRVYSLYRLLGQVLLHGAYEHRGRLVEDAKHRTGTHLLLAGLSYDVALYRNLRLRSTALYCFNRREALRSGFSSPWQTGVGLVLCH